MSENPDHFGCLRPGYAPVETPWLTKQVGFRRRSQPSDDSEAAARDAADLFEDMNKSFEGPPIVNGQARQSWWQRWLRIPHVDNEPDGSIE